MPQWREKPADLASARSPDSRVVAGTVRRVNACHDQDNSDRDLGVDGCAVRDYCSAINECFCPLAKATSDRLFVIAQSPHGEAVVIK